MAVHPPLQPGWIDRPHRRHEIGDLPLESGKTLRDTFVSYVVHGDESRLREAPVLLTTAIGSTHHRLDFLIGEGLAFDPARRCIVVVDALGNGLSSSPSNSATQSGADFPRIAVRDMVESQRRLIDDLGIGRLAAVGGASMGGMQALQWAVSHPQRMDRVVAMTPMARTARWSQLMNEMSRRALFVDAACRVPRPRAEAMRLWLPLTQLLMPRTPRALEAFDTRQAMLDWLADAEARAEREGADPFDWACQTRAYDGHDVGVSRASTRGAREADAAPAADPADATRRALVSIAAEVLVLAPALDLYNPAEAARELAHDIPRARFVALPGDEGHRAASGTAAEPTVVLQETIRAFLA
ncbi:MAG TPA: alpha/beta fold hydrolase [Caldimonas sp.]|nr:alpha/beta fold hydrolase [Caldimonas sp.]HEX2543134.1 alpha/beta fold hydrolase [Caldimonas sp.]